MTDAWLAACTMQLMLHTELRLSEATAIAIRLGQRLRVPDPDDAVIAAFEGRMIRYEDLPAAHRASRREAEEPTTTERRRGMSWDDGLGQ